MICCVCQLQMADLLDVQNVNLFCLAENYRLQFYTKHLLCWPQLQFVAEHKGKIVGYVLAMMLVVGP